MNDSIFISYNSKEYDEALCLKGIMERNGLHCWMAPASIPGGSNYAKEIPKAIKNCRIFVVLLSSKAQESIWVSKEIDLALSEGKVILPYMIENCKLMDHFDFYLNDIQRYEAFLNRSETIKKMITEIRAILGINRSDDVIVVDDEMNNRNVCSVVKKKEDSAIGKFLKNDKLLLFGLATTFFFCIPAVFGVAVPYIIFILTNNVKVKEVFRIITVILSFMGTVAGIGICMFAYYCSFELINGYDGLLYVSIPGLILRLLQLM